MTLPESMRAVEISEPGGPDVLRPVTRPVPVPGAGEILIRIRAAGVNRPDALQRAGAYDPPPDASDLPGLEGVPATCPAPKVFLPPCARRAALARALGRCSARWP